MKVIGIIGTRRRDNKPAYTKTCRAFDKVYCDGDKIVSGGCEIGGDRFAELIHECRGIPMDIHFPNEDDLDPVILRKNPRAAWAIINYARNKLIARDADILIAVVAADRKGGTEDTIKHFRKKFGKTEKQLIEEGILILV